MITKPRDLRTGRSVWEQNRRAGVAHERLKRDLTTEVLVVGAGITGAMIAEALIKAGLQVAVVDRRGPGLGSTTASTALVQYEIDTPLTQLSRKIRPSEAMRAWRRSRLAVDAVAARLQELGVPDVARRPGLFLAGDMLDADGLAREHDARRAAGLPSRLLSRGELKERFGIARQAALMSHDNLTIDPRSATAALHRAAMAGGARIYCPVTVAGFESRPRGVTVRTQDGPTIRARHLVLATGYEFPRSVPQRHHRIISTWAIATRPQPRKLWPEQCLIWEASDPYLYMRTTPDGRIVCGGEDETFVDEEKRDARLARKTATLERKLSKMFPDVDPRADFAWTGSFGQSDTGLPTIAPVPRRPNCHVALGYGGNGITFSQISSDILTGIMTGKPDCDADLFRFRR